MRTPAGVVVHTGDFKIDADPIDGRFTGIERLEALGREGVAALFSDSTNAEKEGFTWTEREVAGVLATTIAEAKQRVLVTTFSSNVFRVESVIRASIAAGRRVAPVGRSVRQMVDYCLEGGFLDVPPGSFVDVDELGEHPRNAVTVLASGCQAEPYSAFGRIAAGEHGRVQLGPGDRVIVSARRIPGNERLIGAALNALIDRGVEVIDDRGRDKIHTSGHALRGEQRRMIELCRPAHFVPMHGESRHLRRHAELGRDAGATCHILETGRPIDLSPNGDGEVHAAHRDVVTCGDRYIDGNEDVAPIVLRDRQLLSQVGFVACTVVLDRGVLAAPVQITSRGVFYLDENPDLIDRAADAVESVMERLAPDADPEERHDAVRLCLRRFYKRELGRRPVILPAFVELHDEPR